MAAQFDFIAGVDISSLSSVTQAQLMQMINQIAPLSNIGGIIAQAGGSLAASIDEGTNGSPSVTDNPRFARYIWLNTHDAATAAPTPYYYNANNNKWTSTSVAAESITNTEIASNAAIAVSKLAYGSAYYLLRTNSGGNSVEYVNPANIFTNNTVPVIGLQSNGTPAYLKTDSSGNTVWITESVERNAIKGSISALNVSQLYGGPSGNILYSDATGVPTWGAPSTAFASGSNIPLNALGSGGASTRQLMHYSGGGGWAPTTPSLQINSSANVSTEGVLSNNDISAVLHTIPHGLNVIPKLIRVVLKCQSADGGWAADDEVDVSGSHYDTGGTIRPNLGYGADTNNCYVIIHNQAAKKLYRKNASTDPNIFFTLTDNKWKFKVYAWA